MLKGRLGLETARIPHADRAGLLWLSRGALTARDGTLSFERGPHVAENDPLEPGHYAVPFQGVSMILLGPGSTVSHDALRLLARHGTALAAVGEDGVRCYTAPPLIADRSGLARRQARAWADKDVRLHVARRMYAWRMGEVLPHRVRDREETPNSGLVSTARCCGGRGIVRPTGSACARRRQGASLRSAPAFAGLTALTPAPRTPSRLALV